ncbi:MAG: hypothetical protein AAB360_00880 [Patescibacteria group bacterium]
MNLVQRALADEGLSDITLDTAKGGEEGVVPLISGAITSVVLPIAGAIAVIYLIYSGILYLTAAGNPDAAKKGQQGVVNAIIGIIIIVLAYVIVNAVAGTANTAVN